MQQTIAWTNHEPAHLSIGASAGHDEATSLCNIYIKGNTAIVYM